MHINYKTSLALDNTRKIIKNENLRGSVVLKMDLSNMSTLRDINPVEAQVRRQGDTNEKQEDNETDKELYDLAVQG